MKKNSYKSLLPRYLRAFILLSFSFACFLASAQTVETFDYVPTNPVTNPLTPTTVMWTCPAGVTSVKVECWGGGGAGGAATNTLGRAGGGGSGGSYVTNTVTVVPGNTYTITVGANGVSNPVLGTSQPTAFGLPGGLSSFSGSGITTITASGGTGGCGGTSTGTSSGTYLSTGAGGKLGGIYGFVVTSGGTATYSSTTSIVDVSGGGGSGAMGGIATSGGLVAAVNLSDQGSGYTSQPLITITSFSVPAGTGAAATVLFNSDIDAGGTATKGGNGANGVYDGTGGSGTGGAGGNGGNGGAGGATNGGGSTAAIVGAVGTTPGGGGAGGKAGTTASARGGAGGTGQVKLTYTVVVPVELVSFDVKRSNKSALLAWKTASERENAGFTIEQSTNGIDFQNIGQVKGNGTTYTATTYSFEHPTPSVGINYYRLKQVDFNGKTTDSPIRSALFGKTGLVIKTTLVHDVLDIVTSDETITPLSIFNTAGQEVFTAKVQGAQRLSISTLPAGTYIVRTATGDVGRFVKQ